MEASLDSLDRVMILCLAYLTEKREDMMEVIG